MSSPSTRIVLVTGANQGIGYFTALQLAQLPGFHVLVGARTADKGAAAVQKIVAAGAVSPVDHVLVDLDSDESIRAAVKEIGAKYGRLDVLVNNAAVFFELPGRTNLPPIRELMTSTYNTNVFGTAVLTDAALPLLDKSDFPRIINVSSSMGSASFMSDEHGAFYHAQAVAYNTSKNAVNGLTVHHSYLLSQKLKKANSRAVSLCPGYCATGMNAYTGSQDPAAGAAGVVNAIQQGPDSDWKAVEFRNHEGKTVPW